MDWINFQAKTVQGMPAKYRLSTLVAETNQRYPGFTINANHRLAHFALNQPAVRSLQCAPFQWSYA